MTNKLTVYELPGVYSVDTAKRIARQMNGQTYMDFMVQYGGFGNMNQKISVCTTYETTEKELSEMFIYVMCNEFAKADNQ